MIRPYILLFITLFPAIALAETNQLNSTLCDLIYVTQGRIGRALGIIAIFILGVLFFLGKISWPLLVTTALGLAMLFGSKTIALALLPSKVKTKTGTKSSEELVRAACPDLY